MRDYGKVHTSFWISDGMRRVSDDARLLALYLLTGQHTNMIGCFRLPDGYECRCRGRGEVIDKKKSELQGLPVFKQCPRCSGRGYPRLKDTEVFKALGVTETTWRRNFKLFFDRLVEFCHVEESFAEKMLEKVTR